jgi:hypothetical protein
MVHARDWPIPNSVARHMHTCICIHVMADIASRECKIHISAGLMRAIECWIDPSIHGAMWVYEEEKRMHRNANDIHQPMNLPVDERRMTYPHVNTPTYGSTGSLQRNATWVGALGCTHQRSKRTHVFNTNVRIYTSYMHTLSIHVNTLWFVSDIGHAHVFGSPRSWEKRWKLNGSHQFCVAFFASCLGWTKSIIKKDGKRRFFFGLVQVWLQIQLERKSKDESLPRHKSHGALRRDRLRVISEETC